MGMCLRKEKSDRTHRPEPSSAKPKPPSPGPQPKDNGKVGKANAIDDDAPGVQAKNASKVIYLFLTEQHKY